MADKIDSARRRAEALKGDAQLRWITAREQYASAGYAEALYFRDRDMLGSVLGSAIALKLFLFFVPATLAVVGLVHLMNLQGVLDESLSASATVGSLATAMRDAGFWKALSAFVSGLFLTLWSGRSLVRVLATTSVAAWRVEKPPKTSPYQMITMSLVLFATILANSLFSQLREAGGLAAGLVAWLMVLGTMVVCWFLVMVTLPRPTADPAAVLPGALLFGVAYTALQWFMQFYLPNKIARTSDTLGQMAVTVATLGNFFLVGRIMSATFVFAAVTYERYGSVSNVIFGLPVVRVLPRKFPWLRTYFALDRPHTSDGGEAPPEHAADALPEEADDALPEEAVDEPGDEPDGITPMG